MSDEYSCPQRRNKGKDKKKDKKKHPYKAGGVRRSIEVSSR